ncbi:MAG: hypothetical protein HYY86_03050 [Candidatus Harrisonbacteria bacterium]|nr:hypothetical protein [Candidatus Harrisonbacteria bacterium]
MDFPAIAFGISKTILEVLKVSWWALLPLGLFFFWREFWLWGLNRLWKKKQEWILLELKIPRNILKTPKAMENVFSALHAIYIRPMGFEDVYFKGEELYWFTCELVGYAGGVNFYIRCLKGFRNLVESAIYSEYPDAEIAEAEDYTALMPDVLPNDIYDLWGNDFILAKDNPYPIQTYEFFEANVEEQRLDPISAITEAMSRLKEGEAIWLQYLLRPVSDEWKKEGEALRDKMMQRKKEKEAGWLESIVQGLVQFFKNLSLASIEHPTWPETAKKEKEYKLMEFLSPGERKVLEGIENKISKLGFEAAIRFIYIDRKDSFSRANISAVHGAMRQFNTQDMNSFRMLSGTTTYVTSKILTYKSWFREQRVFYLKRLIYELYRLRWFPPKVSVLNTEELATVFHFPLVTVEAPLLGRVEAKKGESPSNLPI